MNDKRQATCDKWRTRTSLYTYHSSQEQVLLFNSSLVTCRSSLFLSRQRLLSRLPFGLAEAARLQGLNHAQSLFRRATDVQVVHHFVTQDAFGVDDEQAAQSDALVFDEHAVVACDLLGRIRRERVAQAFDAAFVARRV